MCCALSVNLQNVKIFLMSSTPIDTVTGASLHLIVDLLVIHGRISCLLFELKIVEDVKLRNTNINTEPIHFAFDSFQFEWLCHNTNRIATGEISSPMEHANGSARYTQLWLQLYAWESIPSIQLTYAYDDDSTRCNYNQPNFKCKKDTQTKSNKEIMNSMCVCQVVYENELNIDCYFMNCAPILISCINIEYVLTQVNCECKRRPTANKTSDAFAIVITNEEFIIIYNTIGMMIIVGI